MPPPTFASSCSTPYTPFRTMPPHSAPTAIEVEALPPAHDVRDAGDQEREVDEVLHHALRVLVERIARAEVEEPEQEHDLEREQHDEQGRRASRQAPVAPDEPVPREHDQEQDREDVLERDLARELPVDLGPRRDREGREQEHVEGTAAGAGRHRRDRRTTRRAPRRTGAVTRPLAEMKAGSGSRRSNVASITSPPVNGAERSANAAALRVRRAQVRNGRHPAAPVVLAARAHRRRRASERVLVGDAGQVDAAGTRQSVPLPEPRVDLHQAQLAVVRVLPELGLRDAVVAAARRAARAPARRRRRASAPRRPGRCRSRGASAGACVRRRRRARARSRPCTSRPSTGSSRRRARPPAASAPTPPPRRRRRAARPVRRRPVPAGRSAA